MMCIKLIMEEIKMKKEFNSFDELLNFVNNEIPANALYLIVGY